MRARIVCFAVTVLLVPSATIRADDKDDAAEAKKVVEAYLRNQASPTKCDDNHDLCLTNAVHLVTHRKENKLDIPRTIKELNTYIKGALKDDQKLTLDSVKVDVKENTGLAIGFASFQADETSVYSIFTLTKRDGKWKVMSITQENR